MLFVSLVAVLFMIFPDLYKSLSEASNSIFQDPFVELKLSLSDIYRVREKNHRLEEALMQALVQVNALKQHKEENERLRAQLGYEPPPDRRLIPLEALSIEYNGVPIAINVNKGIVHGLAINQPILNRLGLIGRVEEVSLRYARIQLLTDPGCRVAGRIAESRERGIVRYAPGRGLILDNFPVDGQLKRGDLVISSGEGELFPEGLPVGVVESVKRDETELFAEIGLKPAVNFNAIDELYALVPDASDGDQR